MSICRHLKNKPNLNSYHMPLGPEGMDMCAPCYSVLSPKFDMAIFMMIQDAFTEQWRFDNRQAEWLLAEKDSRIEDLRDTIEFLEARANEDDL